MIIAAVNSTES